MYYARRERNACVIKSLSVTIGNCVSKKLFLRFFSPLFPENFVFPVCISPDGVIFCIWCVWKGILFTAASIKATRGKGADFYRQHLANNDYYSEDGRVEGIWRGSLASAFHLDGAIVQPEIFRFFSRISIRKAGVN